MRLPASLTPTAAETRLIACIVLVLLASVAATWARREAVEARPAPTRG